MNDSEYGELVETSWRRTLTEDEQACLRGWLAAHPEAQSDWEAEAALNLALTRLPEAPVSSNFTALVVQAADREETERHRVPSWLGAIKSLFQRPAPRIAWALILIGALWFGVQQHRQEKAEASRHELAQGLAAFANVAALPYPAAMQDIDTIQQISHLPDRADEELFAVLVQ